MDNQQKSIARKNSLTLTERSGPFQQFCPLSYFIEAYFESDGPDHKPQDLLQ